MRRLFLKLFRRRRMEQDIETELSFHREMAASQGTAIPLGNTASIQEQARDLWRFTTLENLWRDLIYAARGLRKSPALVTSALLSLGLGIGVNTAMFSLGVEFLFSEPAVSNPETLVSIRIGGSSDAKYSVLEFLRNADVFEDVTGDNEESFVNWNNGTETKPIFGVYTAKNYFQVLELPVALGRGFQPDDPNEVVVLRHQFWRRHFNSDPSVLGRLIQLDGKAYTIIGVLGPKHRTMIGFGFSPDVYLPRYLEDTRLALYARLKPGMSIGGARAAVETVARRLDAELPEQWKQAEGCEVGAIAGWERFRSQSQLQAVGVFFGLLLAVVGLVLLIACVNVASLLLARASVRRRETAVRLALGASRGRLLQQFLVESLLLSVLGAGFGLVLAQVIAFLAGRIHLPLPVPIQLQMDLDWRVMMYAALLAVAATLICGMLPARQAVKESIAADIPREPKLRMRRFLVASQVAICVVVLCTGFLFLRNLFLAAAISPGFDVQNTLRAQVHLPPIKYKTADEKLLYIDQALAALRAVAGIEAAAAARGIPFMDSATRGGILTFADNGEKLPMRFNWNAVTSDYFRAMDIPVRMGRTFASTDRGGQKVIVVNRTFAARYLGNRPPLGTVILWGAEGNSPYEIVGVVENTKNVTIGEDDRAQLYEPLAQISNDRAQLQFVMKSATSPTAQLEAVRRTLRGLEPTAGLEVATMYSSIGLAFLPSQAGAYLMGGIGLLGLMLAAVGLYGVLVYSVTRRTQEIGVRMALGANRADVSRMVLKESARLVLTGSAAGLFIALFVTPPLAMFLVPGLRPTDPITFVAVLTVMIGTGLAASWQPVRRATAIDPMTALRYE